MNEEATRWKVVVAGDDTEWTTVESFTEQEALERFRSDEDSGWLKVTKRIFGPVGFVQTGDVRRFWVSEEVTGLETEVVGIRVRVVDLYSGEEMLR